MEYSHSWVCSRAQRTFRLSQFCCLLFWWYASASEDKSAHIWNTITGDCEAELKGHSGNVISAVFSSDGIHIVSASHDKTVRIWNIATGECEVVLEGYTSIPSLPDNRQLPLALPIPDGVFIHRDFKGRVSVSVSSQPSINLHKIFVPPPFHNPLTITCYLSKICLGYASGDVLLLEVCVTFIIFQIHY